MYHGRLAGHAMDWALSWGLWGPLKDDFLSLYIKRYIHINILQNNYDQKQSIIKFGPFCVWP